MQSSLRSTATLFVFNTILVLFLMPRPVSSFPIVALKRSADSGSHALGPSRVNGELMFDLGFAFALLLALLCTWVWVARRMTVAWPVSRTNLLVLVPSTSIQQFPSFHFGTFLRVVTVATFGVDDGGRASTRPRGGLSPPISSVPLARPQRVRFVSSSATRGGASHTVERNLRV